MNKYDTPKVQHVTVEAKTEHLIEERGLSRPLNPPKQSPFVSEAKMIMNNNGRPHQECTICVEAYHSACPARQRYSCPNKGCFADFCIGCKDKTLQKDWRCPFCRCELDGAYVGEPRWLPHQEAVFEPGSRSRRDSMFGFSSDSDGEHVSDLGSDSDSDEHNPGTVRELLLEMASAMATGPAVSDV